MPNTSAAAGAVDYAHTSLILLAFALFAGDHLVHYPVALMAALGMVFVLMEPRALATAPARRLMALFALVWIPMLVSLHDAVDPERSVKTVTNYLHFLPAGFYLVRACARPHVFRMVTGGAAILVLFAGFDAFAQLIWHRDLFGYPYDRGILMGAFYPKQRLGLFLGVFAPLVLEVVRRWCHRFPALWLLPIPLVIVMVTSLKRSGWVMVALGLGLYVLLRRGAGAKRPAFLPTLTKFAVVAAIVALTTMYNPAVRNQLERSSGLFSTEISSIDRASGYRLSLWRTGWRMLEDNWLDGVGARGYRSAYVDYAPSGDFWVERGTRGSTHPHLMVLEVAVETGVLGLLGLLGFYLLLARTVIEARGGAPGFVWLLCALVAWFPLNSHMAFYGSYWSTLVWMLIAIGLAGATRRSAPASSGNPNSS